MQLLKLAGALVALIVAALTAFGVLPLGAEAIVIVIAGAIFEYLGWDWRNQYSEIKTWVQSKSLWSIVIVTVPVIGFLVSIVFGIDLTQVMILGFDLYTIFQWLIGLGGGGFLLGATHAKIKKTAELKKAA